MKINVENYTRWLPTKLNSGYKHSINFGFLNRLHEFMGVHISSLKEGIESSFPIFIIKLFHSSIDIILWNVTK